MFEKDCSHCLTLRHLLQLGHHVPVLQLLQVGWQDSLEFGQVLALQLWLNHCLLRSWLYLMLNSLRLQNVRSVQIVPRAWLRICRSVVYLRCLPNYKDFKTMSTYDLLYY